MHVTLEFVVAAGMIFVMLAVTTATTTSLNYVYTTQKKEFQLVEVAERTLDTILLCSGDPRGWGTDYSINWTDTSGLAAFGLSTSNQTIYRLDADKVTRLCNGSASDPYDNYYYLAPKIAADLLKLTRDYGFRLSILPIFKIAATAPPGGHRSSPQRFQPRRLQGSQRLLLDVSRTIRAHDRVPIARVPSTRACTASRRSSPPRLGCRERSHR